MIKENFTKVDFVIVDGSPIGLALCKMLNKKCLFITNDTSSLVGVNGSIQKTIARSMLSNILSIPSKIIVPDFPPPLTITSINLDQRLDLVYAGPFIEKTKQKEHDKNYLVAGGGIEKPISEILDDDAIYGKNNFNIKPYYENCDAVICHGGHTTIMEALSYGKPVVCITDESYPERYNNAKCFENKSLGVILNPKELNRTTIDLAIKYVKLSDKRKLELYKKTASKNNYIDVLKIQIENLIN